MATIATGVFTALSRGLAVDKRARASEIFEKDAWIVADKVASEFRNGYIFPGLPFEGKPASFSFPTLVRAARDGGRAEAEPGLVKYQYDAERRALLRQESHYFTLVGDKDSVAPPSPPAQVLGDVESFSARYYVFNKSLMKLEWAESWTAADRAPLGLRLDIQLGPAHKNRRVLKTVYVQIPR